MALDLRQNLKLTQQLLMTPQLQQAIKLLQLSRIELEQFVSDQLMENPLLEEGFGESGEEKEISQQEKEATAEDHMTLSLTEIQNKNGEERTESGEVDWDSLSRFKEMAESSPARRKNQSEEQVNYENIVSSPTSLSEYLLEQVVEQDFSDDERLISILLIGNLDEKGYLAIDFDEFCMQEGYEASLVEGVLDTLQRFDPPGVFARNLQETLLLQLRSHRLKNGVVEKILENNMSLLETRNFQAIAKAMKISLSEVIENAAIIAGLEPRPARDFGGAESVSIIPDVYVFEMSGKWIVSMNGDGLPDLRINNLYSDIKENYRDGKSKEYVQEKHKAASWLIRSIQQRQKTIYRVAESILEKQLPFFKDGISHLKPMILKDVADNLDLHESTISRVTTNKYLHSPRGIFELKYFFNSSISRSDGDDVASESVKVLIKEIVDSEDTKKPFSDQKIVTILKDKGIKLARRTVAKYREQVGILPSSKRKKYF